MKIEEIISLETERITNIVGKSFLDCEDIIKLTGLGRENVLRLMHSKAFPTIVVGRRRIVSVSAFVIWEVNNVKE